ncbi:MAG: hypothetical protein AAB964_02105, partial [Patescibacteria group bacterium]
EPLPKDVVVRTMPNIDLFGVPVLGAIAFPLSYLLFTIFSFAYLLLTIHADDIVETNEVLPALAAAIISRRVMYEMHDFPEHMRWLYGFMMHCVRFVLATNEWKAGEIKRRFGIPERKIIMERNGVDVAQFAPRDRAAARAELNLPAKAKIVLYSGHLYGWKGVDTLAKAATSVPDAVFYFIGGTEYDVASFKERFGTVHNIAIVGHRPHFEV